MFKRLIGIVLAAMMMVGLFSSSAYASEQAVAEPATLAFPNWTLIAAQTIGVKDTTLSYAYSDGKSIAAVAAEHNVHVSAIRTAIIDAETAFMPLAIEEGYYTKEEAAQWLVELPAFVDEYLTWAATDDEWSGVSWDTIAATVIDINEADLATAYDQNQSVADVAQAHNVAPQAVIDAIIAYETEHNQTDLEWLAELPSIVKEYVETRPSDVVEAEPVEYVSWDTIAIQTIGIDEDTLYAAYEAGQSIADVAMAHNVQVSTIVDAIMIEERAWAKTAVEEGYFTQAEADAWLAEAPSTIQEYLEWK